MINRTTFLKKNLLLIIILTVFQFTSYSQETENLDSLFRVLNNAKEDTGRVPALIEICKVKWKYAEYSEAKKFADAALSISEKAGYSTGVASAYNQIGIIYWYLLDNEKALDYHRKALELYQQSNDKKGTADAYNRLGHDYADMNNYYQALEYFQKALALEEQLNNLNGVSRNLDLIGYVYVNLYDYQKAGEYYFKALKIAESIGSKRGMAALGHDIGMYYEKQNKLNEALKYASRGLELAKQVGENHLLDEAYSGLEIIHVRMGNYEEAYKARLQYDELENALEGADHAGKIKQMHMQYEFDKKMESHKMKIAQEKEISAIKLQKQKAFTYSGFIIIIITFVFLFFVYRNYHKMRISNQQLKETQEQLIKSEKMAAFGVMASRVAHEIQNPLNFVNNFSELSYTLVDEINTTTDEQARQEDTELLKESLTKINEHGKRVAAIVKQLQEHSDRGTAHEFFEEKNI